MAMDKDLELTTRAGEVDEIAAQEAIEDERRKTEHAHQGGTLEVSMDGNEHDQRLTWRSDTLTLFQRSTSRSCCSAPGKRPPSLFSSRLAMAGRRLWCTGVFWQESEPRLW